MRRFVVTLDSDRDADRVWHEFSKTDFRPAAVGRAVFLHAPARKRWVVEGVLARVVDRYTLSVEAPYRGAPRRRRR